MFTIDYAADSIAVRTTRTIGQSVAEEVLGNPGGATTDLEAAQLIARHSRTEESWLSYKATSRTGGQWYAWDGTVHTPVPDDVDYLLAVEFTEALGQAVDRMPDSEGRKFLAKAWARWSTASGIGGLSRLVRQELRVAQDHFDRRSRWLALSDGWVVDLARLDDAPMAPDPRRRVTRKCGTSLPHDGSRPAEPDMWLHWLAEFVPDAGERDFLQRAAGAALLGGGNAKTIVHLVGPRHSGKTTYLETMSAVFGGTGGFAGDLHNGAIVAKYGGSTNFNQASAKGVRFLTLSEPSTQRTDDSFLKAISGSGDPIRTERKNQNEEVWHAECVLHIAANHTVRFNTTDQALVDRVAIVEFNHVVAPQQDVPRYQDVLVEREADGILRWAMDGAEAYRGRGIDPPESVVSRGRENAVRSSSPLQWLDERAAEGRLVVDPGAAMTAMIELAPAYTDYRTWAFDAGLKPAPKPAWLAEIEAHTGMPADRKGARPKGSRRVWGVAPTDTWAAPQSAY